MIYIYFFLLCLFFLKLKNRQDFPSVFLASCMFFSFVYYAYPLHFLSEMHGYQIGSKWHDIERGDVFSSILAILIFFAGFIVVHFSVKKMGIENDEYKVGFLAVRNKILLSLFFLIFCYYLVQVLDSGRAEYGYAVRKGEVEGSHLDLLIRIIMNGLRYGVLLFLIETGRKKAFLILWALFVVHALTGATGRFSIIVLLAIGFFYLFFKKPVRVIFIFFIVFPVFVPLLVNLKSIIYEFSYLNQIPDIAYYYRYGNSSDAIVANFGHPVYSFIERESLVGLVGYRYFYDIINGFLFYLRIFGLDFGESLTYYNTEIFLGVRESIIPTGYLAFGYVQLSYLGIFVVGGMYRFLGTALHWALVKANFRSQSAYFYFALIGANSFYHGDVRIIVISLILPVLVMCVFGRLITFRKVEA